MATGADVDAVDEEDAPTVEDDCDGLRRRFCVPREGATAADAADAAGTAAGESAATPAAEPVATDEEEPVPVPPPFFTLLC
jgi:hypothetical protein